MHLSLNTISVFFNIIIIIIIIIIFIFIANIQVIFLQRYGSVPNYKIN
jgi:hypothetical protein